MRCYLYVLPESVSITARKGFDDRDEGAAPPRSGGSFRDHPSIRRAASAAFMPIVTPFGAGGLVGGRDDAVTIGAERVADPRRRARDRRRD